MSDIPVEAIEAAAKALVEFQVAQTPGMIIPWAEMSTTAHEFWAEMATTVLAAAAPHLQRQARSDALKEAADEIHTEARWQAEQRIRLAQISDVRASTSYGISLSRLALLEKILLARIPAPSVQRSSNDD